MITSMQPDIETQKRQVLARVYALLLTDQKEIKVQAAQIKEILVIPDWPGSNLDAQKVDEAQATIAGGK